MKLQVEYIKHASNIGQYPTSHIIRNQPLSPTLRKPLENHSGNKFVINLSAHLCVNHTCSCINGTYDIALHFDSISSLSS